MNLPAGGVLLGSKVKADDPDLIIPSPSLNIWAKAEVLLVNVKEGTWMPPPVKTEFPDSGSV